MEKRVTLAIVLCVIVFIFWTTWIDPPKRGKPPADSGSGRKEAASPPFTPEKKREPKTDQPIAPGPRPKATALRPAAREKTYVIDTELYRCELSNRGASILSFQLKTHFDQAALKPEEKEDPDHWLRVLREYEAGKRSLSVQLVKGNVDLVGTTWECTRAPAPDGDRIRVDFEYLLPDGVKVIKELWFHPEAYAVDMTIRLVRPTTETADTYRFEVIGPAGIIKEGGKFFSTVVAVDQGEHGSPVTFKVSDHGSGESWRRKSYSHQPLRYVAVIDKYFFSLLTLPREQRGVVVFKGAFTGVVTDQAGLAADVKKSGNSAENLLPGHLLLEAGAFFAANFAPEAKETTLNFTLYAGPFRGRELEAAGLSDYDPVLSVTGYSMCFLDTLVIPISVACKFFLGLYYGIVHNYGFAILMLTLMVRLMMFPLTRKQMVSMHKYQQQIAKIKPELDRLNQKYKSNPKKKQQELMKLYKEHNISMVPLAGCLPLFVNIPVFFGLFHSLRSSMELRHAPFILWIKDLSAPDALYTFTQPVHLMFCGQIDSLNILPLIMGVTWFAQMYFAPRPTDPQAAQTQKMMMFMPIMFMFFLYNYAAGLSLYWTFNSILGIIEQRFIKRGALFKAASAAGVPGKT